MSLPPDVIFAQKATAIVKAAGMDPRSIDLEKFRRDAPLVFSRAYCAIYREDLLTVLSESSSKEDKILNAQLVVDGLLTKTRNPVLNQISGVDIFNGNHKAIGILVGVLFAEGQRLWLEKVREQNAQLPNVPSLEKGSSFLEPNGESISYEDGALAASTEDPLNRDTMQMLDALKNNPNITTEELERLLYKSSGRSGVEDRLRRRKKKRHKKRIAGKRITDAILHDNQYEHDDDEEEQEEGGAGSNSSDAADDGTAKSSPRDTRRISGRRTADGARGERSPSNHRHKRGDHGNPRHRNRPSSAPYGGVRRVKHVSARLYNPALNRGTLQDFEGEHNNGGHNKMQPKSPPRRSDDGEDPSLFTYDWRSGRRILISVAQQEYEERKRKKEDMKKLMAMPGMNGYAHNRQQNDDDDPSPTVAAYPTKSLSGDVEKWLARMRRQPFSGSSNQAGKNGSFSNDNYGDAGSSSGVVAKEVLPEPKYFGAYRKLEPYDLIMSIEHCHNCQHHSMSVRHNPDEYIRLAATFLRSLAEVAHECGVCARVGVTSFKANVTPRSLITDHDSRIGAFEIQVAFKQPAGKVVLDLLHSKLSTRRWPAKSVVEKRFRAFLASAKVPTHAEDHRHHPHPDFASDSPEPYPVGACQWSDCPVASPLWGALGASAAAAAATGAGAKGKKAPGANPLAALRPASAPPSPPAPAAAPATSSSSLSNVQWAFDMRGLTDPPPEFTVGSTIRVTNVELSAGCVERHALLAEVKDYTSHDNPNDCDIIVRPKYMRKDLRVSQDLCYNLDVYANRDVAYRVGELPEELEVMLMYAMKFDAVDLYESSSGDRTETGNGHLLLTRSSLFNQLRRICWRVEDKMNASVNLDPSAVDHPRTTNTVDIQDCYSEEVLDWAENTYGKEINVTALLRKVQPLPAESDDDAAGAAENQGISEKSPDITAATAAAGAEEAEETMADGAVSTADPSPSLPPQVSPPAKATTPTASPSAAASPSAVASPALDSVVVEKVSSPTNIAAAPAAVEEAPASPEPHTTSDAHSQLDTPAPAGDTAAAPPPEVSSSSPAPVGAPADNEREATSSPPPAVAGASAWAEFKAAADPTEAVAPADATAPAETAAPTDTAAPAEASVPSAAAEPATVEPEDAPNADTTVTTAPVKPARDVSFFSADADAVAAAAEEALGTDSAKNPPSESVPAPLQSESQSVASAENPIASTSNRMNSTDAEENAYKESLVYQNKDMEIVSIILDGEQLCHAHYDQVIVNVKILSKTWDARICLSKEKGSKRRTFNCNWGEFPVAAEELKNEFAYVSIVVAQSAVSEDTALDSSDKAALPTILTTELGKSANSVKIPLYKLMDLTFELSCNVTVPALIPDKDNTVSISIHGHAREARTLRADRILSMTPEALVTFKFEPIPALEDEEDYSDDSDQSTGDNRPSTGKKKRNGPLTASVLDLSNSLYPRASTNNLLAEVTQLARSNAKQG